MSSSSTLFHRVPFSLFARSELCFNLSAQGSIPYLALGILSVNASAANGGDGTTRDVCITSPL